MSVNVFCANEECEAGFNIMGPDPAVNLGGQLIRVSKLGDAFRAPLKVPAFRPVKASWWPRIGFLEIAVLGLAGCVIAAVVLRFV
jgi:hypothetical protein